ncbi:MAG TPA: YraN family protein [Cyclobacteriaceae bacterium]|nr:YraN family protein [Cyclobacteriaceae bacterium]
MTDKIKKGELGEQLAANFLTEKGYDILERNYRYKHSEIDLIVKKDNWLVFVEVKTRTSEAFGYPENFVDDKKAEKILEGAEQYLFETNWDGNVRYDIISIMLKKDIPEVVHFEDAFH